MLVTNKTFFSFFSYSGKSSTNQATGSKTGTCHAEEEGSTWEYEVNYIFRSDEILSYQPQFLKVPLNTPFDLWDWPPPDPDLAALHLKKFKIYKCKLIIFRSKLKQKSNKGDMTRLKKALQLDSSLTEADFSNSFFNDWLKIMMMMIEETGWYIYQYRRENYS